MTNIIKIALPYGMARNDEGLWMFFNREYKPIGFSTRERVRYEDYPIWHQLKNVEGEHLLKMAAPGSTVELNNAKEITRIYFFSDATSPLKSTKLMAEYLKRLSRLSKYTTNNPFNLTFKH